MILRTLKLALLLFVALWAIGGGRYLHERLAHDCHEQQSPCFAQGTSDAHGCLTCSMLAMMTAPGASSPQMAPAPMPTAVERPVASQLPPGGLNFPTPPARGPPSVA
jgi:hypothetical protein